MSGGPDALRLGPVEFDQLHTAFRDAFADYSMDASHVTEENLRLRGAKNGVDYAASVGAYDGDRLVGFLLVGLGPWRGEPAAFDAGTGIVPAYRGRGLARRMFEHALPGLRARGVKRFVLEVLQDNARARRAYEKSGFAVTRELRCYTLDPAALPPAPLLSDAAVPPAPDLLPAAGPSLFALREVDRRQVLALAGEADWQPSWECSCEAVMRLPGELLCLGAFDGEDCVGALAWAPFFRWLLTLVVRRDRRRRGAGTALLRGLAERLPADGAKINLLNVDASDAGMRAFVERLGFDHLVDQYEMERAL